MRFHSERLRHEGNAAAWASRARAKIIVTYMESKCLYCSCFSKVALRIFTFGYNSSSSMHCLSLETNTGQVHKSDKICVTLTASVQRLGALLHHGVITPWRGAARGDRNPL
jgi:hypothetical protein